MRAALIPPKGFYYSAARSNYHLMLAQVEDIEYQQFYWTVPETDFLIVDNGAAEGAPVTTDKLLSVAASFGADEIVVPDVIGDWKATVKAAYAFLNEIGDFSTGLMFVAQGKTMEEVMLSIEAALDMRPFTIGIPRHLVTTIGPNARVNVLEHIEERYGRIPVHLLGTSKSWVAEILRIAKTHPWVRGVDTSMPYNHAFKSLDLRNKNARVMRPGGYFTEKQFMNVRLMDDNIATYLEWASGTESTPS